MSLLASRCGCWSSGSKAAAVCSGVAVVVSATRSNGKSVTWRSCSSRAVPSGMPSCGVAVASAPLGDREVAADQDGANRDAGERGQEGAGLAGVHPCLAPGRGRHPAASAGGGAGVAAPGRPRSCRPMTVRRGGGRVRPWRLLMCSWEIVGVGSAAGSDGGSSVGKALDAAGGGGRVAEPGELVVLGGKARLARPARGRRRAPSKAPRPSRASTAAVHARGPPRPSAARLPRRHGLDLRSSGPRSTG